MHFRVAHAVGPDSRSHSRLLTIAFCVVIAVSAMLATSHASAQAGNVEATARALQKKAMGEAYLATEFGKAQDELESALTQCGTDPKVCPINLRASLYRDLGVVQIGGQSDRAKGIASFVSALKLVPNIQLEADVYTKELDAAFQEARKEVDRASGLCGQLQGDFIHTPPQEQRQLTPIPVYVEYEGEEQLAKVGVRYKGFGMTEWKAAELKRVSGKAWGGLVPPTRETCMDVREGPFQYYIVGQDANGDPLATSGDRNTPYKVQIRRDPVNDPPHLPNGTPPAQCKYEGDCPPEFPGCKDGGDVGTGGVCREDRECKSRKCDGGYCQPPGKAEGEFCDADNECMSAKCQDDRCTAYHGPGPKKARRFWVGASGAFESAFVPTSNDVCKLDDRGVPQNDHNYYCTRDDGVDYPYRPPTVGTPDPTRENENAQLQSSGERSGGGAFGNVRVMLSLDYALTPNVLLGGRIGIVFNNYPGEEANRDGVRFAAPLHLEIRGTYVFGNEPLNNKGLAPYAFVAGGVSQFEAKVSEPVVEQPLDGSERVSRDVEAWHIAGPAFVSFGGGLRYAFIERAALMAAARGNLALGNGTAFSVGPEIGIQFGF